MLKQNNLSDILCLRTTKGKGGKEMLTMSQINDIRDLSQKGYSISKISSLTGLDRKTVRKYLNQDDFSPQPPVAKRRTSIVTPYLDIRVTRGTGKVAQNVLLLARYVSPVKKSESSRKELSGFFCVFIRMQSSRGKNKSL